MDDFTFAIVFSTAALLNFRLAYGVRTTGKPASAAPARQLAEPTIRPVVINEVLLMNSRRFIKNKAGFIDDFFLRWTCSLIICSQSGLRNKKVVSFMVNL